MSSILDSILGGSDYAEPLPDRAFRLLTEEHASAKRQRQRIDRFADKRSKVRSGDEHDYRCERGILCADCLADSFDASTVAEDDDLSQEWATWGR